MWLVRGAMVAIMGVLISKAETWVPPNYGTIEFPACLFTNMILSLVLYFVYAPPELSLHDVAYLR